MLSNAIMLYYDVNRTFKPLSPYQVTILLMVGDGLNRAANLAPLIKRDHNRFGFLRELRKAGYLIHVGHEYHLTGKGQQVYDEFGKICLKRGVQCK